MSVRIKTLFYNAIGFILGPIQLLHLSSYNRQYFGDFTLLDTIFAVIMIACLLFIPAFFQRNPERWMRIILIIMGCSGFLNFLYAPALPRVENTAIISVFSFEISIFMWIHIIEIVLSGWMVCIFLNLWAGEFLSLKTPFKTQNQKKYWLGPIWESELIGSWLLGIGIYIGTIIALPQKTTSVYLFSSIISVLFIALIAVTKTESKDHVYIVDLAILKRASSLRTLIGSEKPLKIIWIFIEWVLFTALLAAYGFAFFQVFRSISEFSRLVLFLGNFAFGGLIVMILSLNPYLNLIFKRLGLIIGAFGIMGYYTNLLLGIPTLPFDIVFGFSLFSLVWGYINRIFRTPFPSASGIIAVSIIFMGYTLLIPAYIRELTALIPIVQAVSISLIIFELISLFIRDTLVPTSWQLQDRFENSPNLMRSETRQNSESSQNPQSMENTNTKSNLYRYNEEDT